VLFNLKFDKVMKSSSQDDTCDSWRLNPMAQAIFTSTLLLMTGDSKNQQQNPD